MGRMDTSACVMESKKIVFIFGGWTLNGASNTIEQFNLDQQADKTW